MTDLHTSMIHYWNRFCCLHMQIIVCFMCILLEWSWQL